MIPNTKISHTILEFGKSLILALPSDHSKEELEATMTIIITAWNAVVMDSWDKGNKFESELIKGMHTAPKEAKIEINRLIKRKKKKFSSDPRSVGNHWIREKDGELVFGCEARLNVKNAPASNTTH